MIKNENIEKLNSLDYSHIYTTALKHILEIHESASKYSGGLALELGSYLGHSTLAIALAGLDVVVYDTDDTVKDKREDLLSEFNVEWHCKLSIEATKEVRQFDFIFHDSDHGDKMIEEMTDLFNNKLKEGGLMMIHDAELLSLPDLLSKLKSYQTKYTLDDRERAMLSLYKTKL